MNTMSFNGYWNKRNKYAFVRNISPSKFMNDYIITI